MLILRRLSSSSSNSTAAAAAAAVAAGVQLSAYNAIQKAHVEWQESQRPLTALLQHVSAQDLYRYSRKVLNSEVKSHARKSLLIESIEKIWKMKTSSTQLKLINPKTLLTEEDVVHQYFGTIIAIPNALTIERLFTKAQCQAYLERVRPGIDRTVLTKKEMTVEITVHWANIWEDEVSPEQLRELMKRVELWKPRGSTEAFGELKRMSKTFSCHDLLHYLIAINPEDAIRLRKIAAQKAQIVECIFTNWGLPVLSTLSGTCDAIEMFKPKKAYSPLSLSDRTQIESDLAENFDNIRLSNYLIERYNLHLLVRKVRKENMIQHIIDVWEKEYPPRSTSPFHNVPTNCNSQRHFSTLSSLQSITSSSLLLLPQLTILSSRHRYITIDTTLLPSPHHGAEIEMYAPLTPQTLEENIILGRRIHMVCMGQQLADYLFSMFGKQFKAKKHRKSIMIHSLLRCWHEERFGNQTLQLPNIEEFERLISTATTDPKARQMILDQSSTQTILPEENYDAYTRDQLVELLRDRFSIEVATDTSREEMINMILTRLAKLNKNSFSLFKNKNPIVESINKESELDSINTLSTTPIKQSKRKTNNTTKTLLSSPKNLVALVDDTKILGPAIPTTDAISRLQPIGNPLVTELEFKTLQTQLDKGFNRDHLLEYIRRDGFNGVAQPARIYDMTKNRLVDTVLIKHWGLQIAEYNIAGMKEISDHKNSSFYLQCQDRDMFFIHGYGETQRRLMFEGNVDIKFDKERRGVIISGPGKGIKKTILTIRQLLNYVEVEMTVPAQTLVQYSRHGLFTTMVKKLMKQCNVFISAAGNEKVIVTATNLVNLTRAKKLIRQLWDKFQDTQIYVTACIAKSDSELYTFLPKVDLIGQDPFVEQIALWRVSRIQSSSSSSSSARIGALTVNANEKNVNNTKSGILRVQQPHTPGLNEALQRDAPTNDTLEKLVTTRFALNHYSTQAGVYLPSGSVRTRIGQAVYFTDKDIMRPNVFSAPKSEGFTMQELRTWFATEHPETVFKGYQTHAMQAYEGDEIDEKNKDTTVQQYWRVVYSQDRWSSLNDIIPGKPDIEIRCTVHDKSGKVNVKQIMDIRSAVCVDVNDLERSATVRTEVLIDALTNEGLQQHIRERIVPYFVYQRSLSVLFSPPSFLYTRRDDGAVSVEYTLKSISLDTERAQRLTNSKAELDMWLVHRDSMSVDGVVQRESEIIARGVDVINLTRVSWPEYMTGVGALLDEWTQRKQQQFSSSNAMEVIGVY